MADEFSRGTVILEDPIVRVEARAPVHDDETVATVHFLGRFDPSLPSPSDHADPEVLDALLRASMAIDKAIDIVKAGILSKAIARARETRKLIKATEREASEVKH